MYRQVREGFIVFKTSLVPAPNIRDDAKEWRKELAVTMVEKDLEKLKMELEEVENEQYCSIPNLLICISCVFVLSGKDSTFSIYSSKE